MSSQAGYEIKNDHVNCLIDIRLYGFWSAEVFERYDAELRPTILNYAKQRQQFSILCDVNSLDVISSGVTDYFKQQLSAEGPIDPKTAMVTSSALLRMQLQRFITRPSRAVFATREEALNWIAQP